MPVRVLVPFPVVMRALPLLAGALGPLLAGTLGLVTSSGHAFAQEAQDGCDAIGDSLANARSAYADACPSLPRLDCDPIVGGWACASYRIGLSAPSSPGLSGASSEAAPDRRPDVEPDVDTDTDTEMNTDLDAASGTTTAGRPGIGECRWIGETLDDAQAGYARMCRPERADCDPVPEGWMCSSQRIGASAPGGSAGTIVVAGEPAPGPAAAVLPVAGADEGRGATPAPAPALAPTPAPAPSPAPSSAPTATPAPAPPPQPASTPSTASVYAGRYGEPSVNWADSYSAGGTCYVDTTGDHGVHELTVDTPTGRATVREAVRRIASGPGISRADALYNDIRCGRGPANDAGDEDRDQCPGRVDQGRAGCGTVGPDWRFVR